MKSRRPVNSCVPVASHSLNASLTRRRRSFSSIVITCIQTELKLLKLAIAIVLFASTSYSQGRVSPDDKALLDKLQRDHSFFEVDRGTEKWLDRVNNSKWALYRAFQEKPPTTVKVFQRRRAGREGQFTMTWFTVASGRVTIVEAFFGDPSGSGELQSVSRYTPDRLVLGTYNKDGKCVPTMRFGNSKSKELCLLYKVPSETRMKVF